MRRTRPEPQTERRVDERLTVIVYANHERRCPGLKRLQYAPGCDRAQPGSLRDRLECLVRHPQARDAERLEQLALLVCERRSPWHVDPRVDPRLSERPRDGLHE